tara:strand:+ start:291 stop:1133 length:843 start_codon:yes stop_codon:yes gene_type:complete
MKIEYIIFLALSIIVGSQLLMNNTNVLGVKIVSKEKKTELGDFPTPQLSTGYKQLSKNLVNNPLYNKKSKPINDDINIIRSSNIANDKNPIYYKPDFYKQDFISPNPLGSTEYTFAEFDGEKTTNAWTDDNVSQHPAFYRSEIEDEKTNIGKFFDVNNRFNDKTSVYSSNNLPDRCFLDKDDKIICNFNDKLQNIPPSLINVKDKTNFLNRIGTNENGLNKDINDTNIDTINGYSYVTYDYEDEREMNGAEVFSGVQGSSESNESFLELRSIDEIKNIAI